MKKIRLLSLLLVLVLLAGCGAANKDAAADSEASLDMMEDAGASAGNPMEYNGAYEKGDSSSVAENRKIIERVYMDVETKEFDVLVEILNQEIGKAGGYIESSSVSGNSYEYSSYRYAEYVIRIPSENTDSFTDFVSANSTVTSKRIDTDDVTLTYVDMESRITALQTEKASLERLLAEAERLEDIITIQDRLTDVIYEIESNQSQLRTYDNLIDFTTINVYVHEVETVSVVEEQTVWGEIGTKLSNNLRNIGSGLVDLFVFIISNIPYFLIAGCVVLIVFVVRKKIRKK